MAAGDDFTLVPASVIPDVPEFHNIVTPMESMKKEYFSLSTTPVETFSVKFKAIPTTDLTTIRNHYNDQLGGHHSFTWKTVPSYIASTSHMTGRWVNGSMNFDIVGDKYWAVGIKFEKSTTTT